MPGYPVATSKLAASETFLRGDRLGLSPKSYLACLRLELIAYILPWMHLAVMVASSALTQGYVTFNQNQSREALG